MHRIHIVNKMNMSACLLGQTGQGAALGIRAIIFFLCPMAWMVNIKCCEFTVITQWRDKVFQNHTVKDAFCILS